ncbi:protein phosphatase 1 regulatory subunit 3B [Leucoraja erinacea]|uniref:protein phosphatase 1 regulatory subunit 3B n=1 Tax=Leucoraja erinaceus TaxID=7782 RepID=UPI002453B2EB|nr:protein phosphatase 1 regulatory subunit 3B [Leucoraja erinacea]
MNCSSMLEILSPTSTMPIDIAMQLYLPPPFKQLSYTRKRTLKVTQPLRPCIHLHLGEDTSDNKHRTKEQKHVSFADSKGLPLTAVKFFDLHSLDFSFNIDELISSLVDLKTADKDNLLLDFAQPSSDFLDFKNRLETESVCLENCLLQEGMIMGTIKVKNIAFEKSLKVRITFDTWKTFQDHDCCYVHDLYGGSDRDTFSFEIRLQEYIAPHERIEFAICYESDGKIFWDSNKGLNYRLIRSELTHTPEIGKTSQSLDALLTDSDQMPGYGIEYDRYGGLRCSYGVFPEWPSYTGYDKMGPYY